MLNATFLSRIQFAFTIGFHILFPTLNIGLAVFITILEGLWLKTHNPIYLKAAKFWTKIFALAFGMGVVSGLLMSQELGTNFSGFSKAVGSVLGPLFSYEVLSAFFLEAGFLGIMLFGWNKVKPIMHFSASLFVTIGTLISAFWIMSANSWMQTPAGVILVNDKYVVTDWLQVIFNPSFLPRYFHMILASFITCCFVISAISAWYILHRQHFIFARKSMLIALLGSVILLPTQVIVGDLVGLKVHEYQPMKTAAIEGLWQTTKAAPLVLFAIPDAKTETNKFAISIPKLASLINTHSLTGELKGLDRVSASDRPPVAPVFFSFRLMVGSSLLMLALGIYGLLVIKRNKLSQAKSFLQACVAAAPLGFVATIAGWATAEIGRQPWVVYHKLRTINAASILVSSQVYFSLALLITIYSIIFISFFYYIGRLIKKGPGDDTLTTLSTVFPSDLFRFSNKDVLTTP